MSRRHGELLHFPQFPAHLCGRFSSHRGTDSATAIALSCHQVEYLQGLLFRNHSGVRLIHEIEIRLRPPQPVIAPRLAVRLIHPLLDNGPFALPGEDKAVMIELVAIVHRGIINLGGHAAGVN